MISRARVLTALLTFNFALTAIAPAQQQQSSPHPHPSGRPAASHPPAHQQPGGRPQGRPTIGPGKPGGPARPTSRPPAARPPAQHPPTQHPPAHRPPANPPPANRPPTTPWHPNRPPNYHPPQSGWRPPTWAAAPRPPWARNNGYHPNYVLVNPRPWWGGSAWGWNRGVQWLPATNYWGGGFWGPLALFTLAGAIWGQTRYTAPVANSPGWTLFQSYGLQPAPCGPQNLVYIYGPNNSVMCAFPNQYVQPGFYYVDPATLQLFVM